MCNINSTVFQFHKAYLARLCLLFYHLQINIADSAFHIYFLGRIVVEGFLPAQPRIPAAVKVNASDAAAYGVVVITFSSLYIDVQSTHSAFQLQISAFEALYIQGSGSHL